MRCSAGEGLRTESRVNEHLTFLPQDRFAPQRLKMKEKWKVILWIEILRTRAIGTEKDSTDQHLRR